MELCSYNLEDYLGKVMAERSNGLLEVPNCCLDLSNLLSIMSQVGEGIGYLHGHDVVHGKIKPKNGILPMSETS